LTTVGLDCVIAGWGFINKTVRLKSEKLQSLEVKIADWNMCKRWWPRTLLKFHICAGVPGALNKAACDVIKL